ncbi:MAG: ATPase, T2SS/T4P/T4SS family, partial [Candidatus Omnitrophica bacterium]|nr:ATPase, T2SS/T4P/T4SS family [Candidatus Omnitrophota bacterium]
MALRLGEILVEKKLITPEQLKSAVAEQKKTGEMLGQILISMGFVSESKMLHVLAEQQGIPFVELKDTHIEDEAIKKVPPKFAWHYKIMPIAINGNVLTIAISNPFDMWPIDDLETHLGYRIEKVLATSSDIVEMVKKVYGVGADTIERILAGEENQRTGSGPSRGTKDEGRGARDEENVQDLEKMAGDASVVKLVNQIMQQAIKDRATDIHIEHFRNDVTLRYRVDGVLADVQVSENIRYLYPAIVSRIKIMSGLDIIERRIPQDGRAKVKIGESEYDMRVSIIPTIYGESIVIRILALKMLFSIADLGMSEKDVVMLEELIKKPHGIIFVTGPTGSGKSTTLYTCLSKLNTRARKIITIEDPVEYELKGISQIQVMPKVGLTFAQVLRSTLRHDPDVMMVGEVRDLETAEIAIQTALTGHLVFSTLHTNDAASGITRLIDIGVEPYLIASSVEAFIAQRLVRVICPKCKEKVSERVSVLAGERSEKEKEGKVRIDKEKEGRIWKDTVYYRGKGCKACNNTGYMGRTGIYEILPVNEEVRKLISQKASVDEIKEKAAALGMRTLKEDGWDKVAAGITTPEEVM